ncbi:MAG: HYR domain-containing protein [Saprospiraceae bacterium]|nr:HYR domain-containing protein [Saprospiraceae bacterium]
MRNHTLTQIINQFSTVTNPIVTKVSSWILLIAFTAFHWQQLAAQCNPIANEIQGTVFVDKNYNGILDASDVNKEQIQVRAYSEAGQLISQAISDASGKYTLTGLTNTKFYRLEISKPLGFEFAKTASQGANDVKFVVAPACNIQFGLQDKEVICTPENAKLYTTCFVKSGGAETAPTLVQMPFLFNSGSALSKIAMLNQTGAVWGLAWNKSTQVLYSAAFVKYGASLGQGGTGGIYVSDPTAQTTNLFLNVNALGIQTGQTQNMDPLDCAYSDLVGKAGLGDMDISDDDQFLFVSNLYNNSLVVIPTDQPSAANIMEIKIPDPGCNNGDYAVGAVEYYKGQVYIGVTCTAENSKNQADCTFHIYEFNLLTKTFNLIFSTPFAREYWLKTPGTERPVSQWLTSIAFSDDNFMILGITDRTGHTYCDQVYPLTGTFGDILMTYKDASGWHLENKSVAGSRIGCGPNNFEGPGKGEFFGDDFWSIGPGLHPETSFGTVCVLSGTADVVSAVFDPIYESFSGGFHKYSALNGKKKTAIQLYNKVNSAYGKSSGLGDLAIGCPKLPLEIGNYVWLDENENGIQDAAEKPWRGLQLALFDSKCVQIASTTTDNNGNYLFNSSNVDLDGNGTTESLKSFETYFLVVKDPSFNKSIGKVVLGIDTFQMTIVNKTPGVELTNSDASLFFEPGCQELNGYPVVKIHTGGSGQNDFSFDIGFIKLLPKDVPNVIKEYDLALIKKVDAPTTVANGDLVNFNIIISNQGNQPVHQIEITDFIHDYFTFEANLNPGWILSGSKAQYLISSSLDAGKELSINIKLRLNKSARPNEIVNTAEISKMMDAQGALLTDLDSTPDEDENNDKGGVPNTETDNIVNNNSIDEDDHDRESLPIVDLALINKTINTAPVKLNETVSFEMEIFNQGNIAVNHYDIVNYIPSGFQFVAGLNPGWVLNGNKATTTINEDLLAGQSKKIQIHLILKSKILAELVDVAEIFGMRDASSISMKDFDSTPDQNPANDQGGQLYTATDNIIHDDGTLDEDDQDPASIQILDLALILTTDITTPVKKNQDVLFHVTVCNQGNVSVKNIGIVDYLPNGLEVSPLENHGWFTLGGVLRNTIQAELLPNTCATIDLVLRVKQNATANELVNRAEITTIFDNVLNNYTDRDIDSQADYLSGNDAGGVVGTATDNIFTGDGITDEDDSDPAALLLMDLALIKRYNANISLQEAVGVNFTVQLFNQGNVPVKNVTITDYLPEGFALTQQSISGGWVQNGTKATFIYTGTLAAFGNIILSYSISQVSEFQPSRLINIAEISKVFDISGTDISAYDFDSTPDSDPTNDAGGEVNTITDNSIDLDASIDEDDADPAGVPVFDLALRKTLFNTKVAYRKGDTVEYKMEVFNQGNVVASEIEIVDYLNANYIFIEDLNPSWSVLEAGKLSYKFQDLLFPGKSVSKTILLVIKDLNKGEFIPNYSEIKSAKDNVGKIAQDFDSVFDAIDDNDTGGQPGSLTDNMIDDHGDLDEDDHDGAESNPVNFDLSLIKDIDQNIVKKGDLINFRIRVYNQGLVACSEIELVDYIPEGLVLVDPDWEIRSIDAAGLTRAYYLLNEKNGRLPQGGLKTGDSVTVYVDLQVDPNQTAGIIVNRAEIFRVVNYGNVIDDDSHPDDDVENDPGGVVFNDSDGSSANPDPLSNVEDEDDADPAGIIVVDLERSVPCSCLDNATNSDDGQFYEELSFRSISNDIWFIFEVNGLYHELSPAPPNAPTDFITGPGGYILDETNLGDGTSIYTIRGNHIDGIGYSIILSNQYGVKLNSGVNKCFYNDPTLLKSQNNVCSGQTIRYEVKSVPNAIYSWSLLTGGTILTNPANNYVDVLWTGVIGSTHTLTIDVDLPDSCYSPLLIPVTIGATAGPVSCIGSIQVSLDANCEVLVTPKMLLIGGPYDYTSYAVMIFNKDGSLVPNNTLYYDHIGKTLTAKVINVCSGNSCWATVSIEDKVKPTLICLNDTIDCTLMKSYLKPFINDNCDPNPYRVLIDEQIENTPCNQDYSKIVTRTYVAKDHSGNVSLPCTMNVYLRRINLDSIDFPDSLTRSKLNPLICTRFKTDSLGHPLPSVSGIPYYRGLPAWPNTDNKYCDYAVSYEDIELNTGKDCVVKILRNWKFTIWYCTTFEQRSYRQLIEIVDTIAPTITCPYDITATTNSFTCNADVWIPMPKVFDSCGQILSVDLSFTGGLLKDFRASYVKLPVGVNNLTFTAYDMCYNSAACTFIVTVEDQTPPVAICDKETVITLDRFGEAWIPATVFDDGSYDDCHIKNMQVRRMNPSPNLSCGINDNLFRDSIRFCCQDIGTEVMVVFKVTDAHGNENTCMVIVEVQDKTIPHIFCPHDVTIACDYHYDLNDLSEFGKPTVSDNCNVTYTERLDVQINQCREGYIDRIFIAGNSFGQDVCVQRISVINLEPFDSSDIVWPLDLDTNICITDGLLPETLPTIYGFPRITEDFCDLVGISYVDHTFRFINGSDACYKILRKWKVLNWCRLYDPTTGDPNIYTHEQIIKIFNTTPPEILTGCKDTVFAIIDTACFGGDAYLVATASDLCTPANELVWEYHIDFNGDHIEDRSDFGVGDKINASGFYPLGKHKIKYVFEDRCGNKSVCEQNFEIINCKPPTAYCILGLSTSLVPMDLNNNGSVDAELVTIWAKDLDRGSYHICGYPLTYSIGRDTSVKSVTYDCDSIGRRTITLCVTASNGKQDCCNTFIDVQDNNNVDLCGCVTFPPNITIKDCTQNTDPVVINSRPSIGNCTSCVHTGTSSKDSIILNVPNTCFVIHRTWTVTFNCIGEPERKFDRVQTIIVTTDLRESDIVWPSDSILVDNCRGAIDTATIGEVPRFCVYNNNVMLMYTDKEIRREQNCVFYERIWTVFSKCVPSQSYGFRQVLKVVEGAGIRYIVPPNITVTDCKKPLLPDSLNGVPKTNCPCNFSIHTFKDSIVNNVPNTCYVVYRKWTSTFNCPPDVSGTFTGTQLITVRINLTLNDITWPSDSVYVDNCRGSVDTAIINHVPRLKKDFCGFVSIRFTDQTILQNDTCKKILRTWTVANDCSSTQFKEQFSFVQLLKVVKPNGPQVDYPDDITVTDCKKNLLPDSLNGFPKLNCPCDNFTHTYIDSVVNNVPNACYVVYRKWTSVYNCPPEVSGTFKGTQLITIRINLQLSDIVWPKDSVIVDNCPGSVDTGLINNVPKLLWDYCGYVSITYIDQTISKNDSVKIIHRTWTVGNDCSSGQFKQQFTFRQVLKVTNPDGPRVKFPADITVTDCKKPFLPDSLNGYPTVVCICDSIKVSYKDDTVTTSNLEVCFVVERNWSVRFICKPNYDSTVFYIQKITLDVNLNPSDITWPKDSFTSFTCNPTLDPKITGQPSLKKDYCGFVTFAFKDSIIGGGECLTILRTWTAINSCSITQRPTSVQHLILKNQGPPSITCAKDTIVNADPNTCGKSFILMNPKLNNSCNAGVTFTNNAPSVFPVGMTTVTFTAKDSCNNTAQCTVKVTVIETVPPDITCPGNLTVPCSFDTKDLSQFGTPVVTDNCPGTTFTETVTRVQNICGIGTITRKFVAIDASGNRDSCTQVITVNNPDPLQNADMIWPPSPISVSECESIDTSNTGTPKFDSSGITCFKVNITFSDSNLCKVRQTCDIERTWMVFDSCTNVTLTFVQLIQRDDTTAPNILGVQDTTLYANDTACNNFVVLKAFVDNCDSLSIKITNNSPYGNNNMEDASGFYPVGMTTVTFTAEDACCNVSTKIVKITIIDTIAPEFTCIKVVRKIKDDGCATFNSQDFVSKLKDNCTDSAFVITSFDRNDFSDTIRIFCCDSIRDYEYTQAVTVYFKDDAGNLDSCATFLQAVDQDTICGPTFSSTVKGFVRSRKSINMAGVDVMLNSGQSGVAITRNDGFYGFYDMPHGGSYKVAPQHDLNPVNGVTTADIIHIQRHILGTTIFTDPLKFVAADVNNNNRITAADVVDIRKLILGKIDHFTNSPSWKFLLSDFKFKDQEDPLSEVYPTSYQITNINKNYYLDFTGVKMGDVDDSNNPSLFHDKIQNRESNPVLIVAQNNFLEKDQLHEIELDMSQFAELEGMQFELVLDPTKAIIQGVVGDESNQLKEDAYFIVPGKNSIRISYVKTLPSQETWKIKLRILVKQSAQVAELLEIGNEDFISEAYFQDGSSSNIHLDFLDQNSVQDGLSLFQNIPNPFKQTTIIPFQTSENTEIAIRIIDMNGRLVFETRKMFSKGYHEFELNKNVLNKSGIYYYQMKTNKSSLFRRMILID